MKNRASMLALLASAATFGMPVSAQQAPAPARAATAGAEINAPMGSNAADIVVTALKRNETAQNAPATITILSSEALATHNITAANQLNAVVPGLTMSIGVAGLPGTSFRGLGSNSAVFSLEPSVAQYQDGVYLGHARDYVAPLYDVDHVEFIKGTQSTLLGKNTSLGAISIVNRRPTKSFDYNLRVGHGFGVNGNKADGGITVPVGDRVQVRAAFLAARDSGYFDNTYESRSEARQTDLSGRLVIAAQPTDSLDVLAIYQHDYRRLRGQSLEVVTDPNGTIATRATAVGVPFDTLKTDLTASGSAALGGAPAGIDPFDKQDTNRFNLILDQHLGDFTLTSQTAYVEWNSTRSTDLDFTAANLFSLNDRERSRSFTQELRLSSPSDGRLTYLAGLYYYNNKWKYDRIFGSGGGNTVGFPLTGQAASSTSLPTRAYSAFASGTFEIVDWLKLDAGLRYTHERKSGDFVRASTGTLAGAFPTTPFTKYEAQVRKPLDYNFGARFEATSTVLVYGSYSKGSKSGGFQDAPTTVAGAPFQPETAYSTELGAKVRLSGGYVTAALFNTRVKGFQTSYTSAIGVPPVAQTIVGNSNVRARGVEASGSYWLTPSLRVGANVVYSDAKFTDAFPANGSIAQNGDRLTRAPKWSGQGEIEYSHAVSDALEGFAGATLNFASQTLYQFVVAQPLAPKGASHALLDGRIGIRGNDGRWEVAAIGTNLLNRRYIDFATSISSGGGAYYGSFNRPRVVQIQLTLKH